MAAKISQELADALLANQDDSLEVVDPAGEKVYFIVDAQTHQQAMDALERKRNHDAIAEGLAQMQAGEGIPIDEARRLSTERLLARK